MDNTDKNKECLHEVVLETPANGGTITTCKECGRHMECLAVGYWVPVKTRKYFFQKEVTEKIIKRYIRNEAKCKCYMCGHDFEPGDIMSLINNNSYPGKKGFHNFLVCVECDDDYDKLMKKWTAQCEEAKARFWWMNT